MSIGKYVVDLKEDERERLERLISRGTVRARMNTRARVLLKADAGLTDEQVAQEVGCGVATVGRVRQRFVEEGLEPALRERFRPGQRPKLDGHQEAHLVAVACSQPPEGHARWTLRLLADKVVELDMTESISHETVRQILKKTSLNPGRRNSGASPR
jgi:transposase